MWLNCCLCVRGGSSSGCGRLVVMLGREKGPAKLQFFGHRAVIELVACGGYGRLQAVPGSSMPI
jgi:hypothetical protein